MNSLVAKFQIGKQGLTAGIVEALNNSLKTHKQIRVSILKSCCRDKSEIQKLVDELQEKLAAKCSFRIIGFTIIINKLTRSLNTI